MINQTRWTPPILTDLKSQAEGVLDEFDKRAIVTTVP